MNRSGHNNKEQGGEPDHASIFAQKFTAGQARACWGRPPGPVFNSLQETFIGLLESFELPEVLTTPWDYSPMRTERWRPFKRFPGTVDFRYGMSPQPALHWLVDIHLLQYIT